MGSSPSVDRGFIAVDWGTSNRRSFRVDADGAVLAVLRDGRGALAVPRDDYPAEIAWLRERLGGGMVMMAGMVGSERGWLDLPHIATPAGLDDLAAGMVAVAPDVFVVPGVAMRGPRFDVMRGEEVQVLGAIAARAAPADALFCQPGTHNKWVETGAARIRTIATAMTGELFALLKSTGSLAGLLVGEARDDEHFAAGLMRGRHATDLTTALFEVRADTVLGRRAESDAASFASGILIGADVGARGDLAGRAVHLLGDGALASLYAAALRHAGAVPVPLDAAACFVAGMVALRKMR